MSEFEFDNKSYLVVHLLHLENQVGTDQSLDCLCIGAPVYQNSKITIIGMSLCTVRYYYDGHMFTIYIYISIAVGFDRAHCYAPVPMEIRPMETDISQR